jgi:hypothetical protein
MGTETRRAILDLISTVGLTRYHLQKTDTKSKYWGDCKELSSLENHLYGLFDGFLYDELLLELATFLKYKKDDTKIVTKIYNEVSNYPKVDKYYNVEGLIQKMVNGK